MMIPDDLIFINAVPVDKYFIWQEEVLICNFLKHGIKNIHVLVWCPEARKKELKEWYELKAKYPEVSFFYYPDNGVDLVLYIPQLRPHILKQHFKANPELNDKVFFYHDSDIIFNYLPDFQKLVEDDICWQSDTSGYLDYKYLRRKEAEGNIPEDEAVKVLTDIGRVTVNTMKSYSDNTGGAQYILKGIDSVFWEDVERQVIEIRKAFFWGHKLDDPNRGSVNYKYFTQEGRSPKGNEDAGFQSWCADMWAVNFALWSRGIKTQVTKELDFSWATNDYKTYTEKPIFHLAGATGTQAGVFYKGGWINKSPIGVKHFVDPNNATYAYTLAIQEVRK